MSRILNPSSPFLLALLAVAPAFSFGCVTPGAHVASPGSEPIKTCGPDGTIEDFEDGNNQINVVGDRGGYWYTYVDKEGSTVSPEPGDQGGTFAPVEGGHESKYAAEFKGKLAGKSIVYAAMGLNFEDPKSPFDASQYAGITFWAKRAAASTSRLTVKLPDGNTDPDGQVCSACFNDYGYAVNVGEQWSRFVLPFHDLRQEPDWGAPRRPHVDASKLFAIHWEAKAPGAEYDFLVDDIAFICKGP
jgi:endoglucanase